MGKEVIEALDLLVEEKGINKEVLLDAVEKSLKDEFKSQFSSAENCEVKLDRVTGNFKIYSIKTVVDDELSEEEKDEFPYATREDLIDKNKEITLSDALKLDPKAEIGSEVKIPVEAEVFTRRAVRVACGTVLQKIREEEKVALYNEYHSKEHEIITGLVQRVDDRGNIVVNIGKTQTVLIKNECVKGENYKNGDRIKLYVLEVSNIVKNNDNNDKSSGKLIIKVSRKTPLLVKRLFEEEVTEIAQGSVKIVNVAREEGSRTKIAVKSEVPNVDPIGACVGENGTRVRTIVDELGGEQIDVIAWNENPAQFIVNALSPAKVVSISAYLDENNNKKATVVVSDQQLSLAIGKAGQNVRLAAKLTGYGIDIKSESQMENSNADADSVFDEDMDEDVFADDELESNDEVAQDSADEE